MSMTPQYKALLLRQLAQTKKVRLEQEAMLADQQALKNTANKLMHKALHPMSGEVNTFTVSCKKHHAEKIVAILVAEGFTEENFWEVSYETIVETGWDGLSGESTFVTASVILT
jgi:hypothetical protein